MGTKNLTDVLPQDKTLLDSWTTALIDAKIGQANGIAPLGADGLVPPANLPNISLAWGNISGTLSDQTDLLSALGGFATTSSPAFSGVPTAPKASIGANTLQIASTSFVQEALGTIPSSAINTAPIVLATDTTFTADDADNKYYVVDSASSIEITLPSAIGLGKQAINFIIQNNGSGTIIVRDSLGSLLQSISSNKFVAYSVNDDTVQSGYKSVLNMDIPPKAGFITPPLDIYKSGVIQTYGGSYGRDMQMIELATNKWAIIYSTTDTIDTYVQLFEWTGSAYNYGTAVEVTDTYNSAFIWKQSDTLLGCGLETGDGANYMRSLAISGLTITKNAVVAVQTSTGAYHGDTTRGVRLSDTQSLLYYTDSSANDPSVRVATVNGTSWTFGTEYSAGIDGHVQHLHLLSPTEFYIFWNYSGMRIARGTISGSTITLNTADTVDVGGSILFEQMPHESDNVMFDRGDGTMCAIFLNTIVNFSMTNGVYAEIGSLELTGTSNTAIAMFKASNNRAVAICDDAVAGEENALACYVIDYSTSTPTLISYIPLSNIGNVHFTDTFKVEFTAGTTSFSIDIWDDNAGQYCNVEISLGDIAI